VAAQANAEAVVDGVAHLAAPHALLRVASAFFGDTAVDRGVDLLDPRSREGWGDVEGGVNVMLEVSKGVFLGETGRALVEGLTLHLQGVAQLSHASCKAVARFLVGAEVLDFSG